MLRDNRIKFFAPADYTENSELDVLVKAIIIRTASNEVLEDIHYDCKKEQKQNQADTLKNNDKEQEKRFNLILSLDASANFATTHEIMIELLTIENWTSEEIDKLLDIAINNHPVRYLLNDKDVNSFYKKIIKKMTKPNEKSQKVESYFKKKGKK